MSTPSLIPSIAAAVPDAGDKVMGAVKKAGSAIMDWAPSGTESLRNVVKDNKAALSKPEANPAAQLMPARIIDNGSYKSLANLQAHGYGKVQKEVEAKKAQQIFDINAAPTPALKMQAMVGTLNRLEENPKYQAMRPESKVKVKGIYYDRYVAPVLKLNGIDPPSKEQWLAGHGTGVKEQKQHTGTNFNEATASFLKSAGESTKLLGDVLKYSLVGGVHDKDLDSVAKKVTAYGDAASSVSDDYRATFATKHGATAWLANTGGQVIGSAPAYMVVGGGLGTAAEGIATGLRGIVPSFAEKAAMSRGWSVAVSSLKAAGDVFTVDKAEHKTTGQALRDAAGAAIIGASLHGVLSGLGEITAHLRFKGAQVAVGGEPLASTVAEDASKGEAEAQDHALDQGIKSLVNKADPQYQQTVENEKYLRESVARQFHPEKADAAGASSVWRNLSKVQRAKIIEHISSLSKLSAETMPLVNPEVQTVANGLELTNQAKADPAFAARMQAVQKMTGMNPAEVITKAQATEVADKLGLTKAGIKLSQATDSAEQEYEPGDGAYAQLKPDYQVSYRNAKSINSAKLSSPSISHEDFINGTIKYLEDSPATQSGKVYFENPEHHLLQVAYNSDAPASVQKRAVKILEDEFGQSKIVGKRRAAWLKNHTDELRLTGKLSKEGNVFRSTKLMAGRHQTQWQNQLSLEDTPAAQAKMARAIMQASPVIKQQLLPLLDELAMLKQKASTPETAAARLALNTKVAETLGRYK